ncbi:MAG: hypothetical protein R2709_00510 [Marmoricola sp.]
MSCRISDNSGCLIEIAGRVLFHLATPSPCRHVQLTCSATSAPGRISECIDYARAVGAAKSLAIHDKITPMRPRTLQPALAAILEPKGLTYRGRARQ